MKSNHRTLFCLFLRSFLFAFHMVKTLQLQLMQMKKYSEILTLKKKLETENKLSDGYTIQLYYGELEEANKIMKEYQNILILGLHL